MKSILSQLIVAFISLSIYAQSQPQISSFITVNDGREESRILFFGVDPQATDGIDANLGEALLPPFPPLGVFEAQMFLPANNFNGTEASYADYRAGTSPFSGEKEHRIRYQRGEGDSIVIYWALPQQISGRLQDIITGTLVDVSISGNGSFLVPNPDAIQSLKLLITYNNATDVEVENSTPEYYNLSQNYPNPFNPSTKIQYSISSNQIVKLKIYDVLGKEITTLVNKEQSAGTYEVNFDGNNLTSGIYFYTITAGDYTDTKSMILMK
jgi:hypothetical protein